MDSREQAVVGACRSIVRAAALIRKELDRVLTPVGLSGPQFGILAQLEAHGSMPLSELGKRLWVSCGNVTGLVDRLNAAGYVRRTRLETDRRVILAELTEKGEDVMRKIRPLHSQCLARFTAGFEDSELHGLQMLAERIQSTSFDGPEGTGGEI